MTIDNDIRQSLRFKMGRGRFCSVLFSVMWVKPVMVLLCMLVVSAVLASMYDLRYFIVSLMITFLVCPMVLTYMYYHYGFGKYCYFNVTEHSLRIEEDGVMIDMYFPMVEEDTDAEGADDDKEDVEEGDIAADTDVADVEQKHLSLFIDYDMLRAYYVARKSVFFPIWDKKMKGFLWIPENAYSTDKEFIKAIDLLSQRVKRL